MPATAMAKATKRKGPAKAEVAVPTEHFRNLRCTREGCDYLAKATDNAIALGRLRCPIHKTILRTREERGETRGRYAA